MEPARQAEPPQAAGDSTDEFVHAVSHDLRGPLLNFQGFLRRLEMACRGLQAQIAAFDLRPDQRQVCDALLEQKIRPSIDVLDRNARRMDRLLTALLELSRAGREPVQFEHADPNRLIGVLLKEFEDAAAERNAIVQVEPLAPVWADPDRLQQCLRHLLSNALKFLSPGRAGEIWLGGAADDNEKVCWVRDNGVGIKPPDQTRIFLPFARIQEIEAPGEGVGLATVRKLMTQQGGRVWVESIHHQGSTFYLGFPPHEP